MIAYHLLSRRNTSIIYQEVEGSYSRVHCRQGSAFHTFVQLDGVVTVVLGFTFTLMFFFSTLQYHGECAAN